VSHATLGALSGLAGRPAWVDDLQRAMPRPKPPPAEPAGKLSYAASFDFAQAQIGLDGEPRPRVRRRPRYDDEPLGPSIFRTEVVEQSLPKLTLPGLYIGRSRLANVSLAGSDLHLSTFNWSDFADCDFSECDLSRCDLRGCNVERCTFVGADLRRSDLRVSGFANCDFSKAQLDSAILNLDQRLELSLTDEQASIVAWTDKPEEPEGG